MTTDVSSAYPHGHMRSAMPMVYYLLDRAVTMLIAESHGRWSQHVLEDSTCIMKIERALYGLIESAKLWYEEFTGFLKNLGFLPNPYDHAYSTWITRERLTHFDDCFMDCYNPEQLNYVKQIITEKYGGCMRTNWDVFPYSLRCYLTFDNSRL